MPDVEGGQYKGRLNAIYKTRERIGRLINSKSTLF